MHRPPVRSKTDYADVHGANSAASSRQNGAGLRHPLGTAKVVKEPDALKCKAGKIPISVEKDIQELVQLGHSLRECDLLPALDA